MKPIVKDEKFERQDLDLFEVLAALDKKDYGYYDRLSEEQKKKFSAFMLTHWMSAIKGRSDLQGYYVLSTEYNANKYLFNEFVSRHPKLQWLMLCAASSGLGKQFHQWIPMIRERVSTLREPAKVKDIKDYYTKIYPKADSNALQEIAETYVAEQKCKMKLAQLFPHLKLADIETLSQLITDDDIKQYEQDLGNG